MKKEKYVSFRLGNEPYFPIVAEYMAEEFVALGGKLETPWLESAYAHGFFPFFAYKRERISWSCPTDRFVIFTDRIHISHSMRNLINKNQYTVTLDKDFPSVIRNCSSNGGRNESQWAWLGPDIIKAYIQFHKEGHAHSVEVWDNDGKLVGGLYGVLSGEVFCGESMFSLVQGASKLALISLAKSLNEVGIKLIDCQYETPHLLSMGGEHMTYMEYIKYLGW